MSASSRRTNPSFSEIAMAVSTADGDKEWLDFACVITGYGMLIVLSGGLWDETHVDMCGKCECARTHAHTHAHCQARTLSCCVTTSL